MTAQPAPSRWLPWLGDPILRRRLRNAFLLLLIGLLAGAIAFAAYQALRADDLWRQAQQALADRDFDRARACLGDYLALRPGSAEGHFLMARTCRQQRPEDFETAHTHLALARELGWPDEPSTLEGRLLTFQAGGGPFARERPLRESVDESSPDMPLLLEGLARGCIRGDRLPAANSYLDAWVQRDPDDWYPRLWRGALFQHTSKADLAVADYQRVLQARPGDVQVKKHLGLMLVQSGHDYQEALRYLSDYLQDHPDDADARVAAARCRGVLENPAAARAALRETVAAHPDHYDALLALAVVEMDLDGDEEARKLLGRLEPLAPQTHRREALDRLVRLDPVATNVGGAERLQTVLHLTITALQRLGRAAEAEEYAGRLARHQAALEELARLIEAQRLQPKDPDLMVPIGVLSVQVGLGENGERWLLRALSENPDHRAAHRALAEYYDGRPDPESHRLAEQHRQAAGGAG